LLWTNLISRAGISLVYAVEHKLPGDGLTCTIFREREVRAICEGLAGWPHYHRSVSCFQHGECLTR
jgi:hypothetical protein